jgi:hypothetical protein
MCYCKSHTHCRSRQQGYTSVFSDASANLAERSEIVRARLDPKVSASCLGMAYLAKKDPSPPWFLQEAVAHLG